MQNNFFVDGELLDCRIMKALKKAVTDYENGEIAEVRDLLMEIVDAIDEWSSLDWR